MSGAGGLLFSRVRANRADDGLSSTDTVVIGSRGLTPTVRTRDTLTFGSSTYRSLHNDSLTNLRGNPTPEAYRSATWQERAAALVGSPAGKTITSVGLSRYAPAGAGGKVDYKPYETTIRRAIQSKIADGTLTPATKVVFGGVNANDAAGETEYEVWQTDQGIMADLRRAKIQRWALGSTPLKPDYSDSSAVSLWNRKQSYFLASPHPWHGLFGFHEAHLRALEDPFTATYFTEADKRQIALKQRPDSLVHTDRSHDVGFGYHLLGNYYAKVEQAFEGGIPFLPTIDYFVRRTDPGVVADLAYIGDLAGVTASVDHSDFAIGIVENPAYPGDPRPRLIRLTAAKLPRRAGLPLTVTLTKPGLGSERYNITVSISRRTGTAPAKVRLRNRVALVRHTAFAKKEGVIPPYFQHDTRKLSLVWIARMEEDDGANLSNVPRDGSDTREHRIINYLSDNKKLIVSMRRTASGKINITCLDSSPGLVEAINVSSGPFRKDEGFRALFLSYDADQPGKCAIYASAGRTMATGNAYAGTRDAITPGGTGTLGLGRPRNSVIDGLYLFRPASEPNPPTPNPYLEATKASLWLATNFIDFSVRANRDRFFNEAAQTAVDLGTADGTVLGITPYIYLPGDAAEMYIGGREIDHNDRVNGGVNCRNFGSGPGFVMGLSGQVETVS